MPAPTYYVKLTTLGLTRLAEALANNTPLVFTHVAVGDGNGSPITPDPSMTALVNERARVATNEVSISENSSSTVVIEGIIPSGTGGFTIREAGAFNGAGELIAIASYPPTYKPSPSDGVTIEAYVRLLIDYASVEAIALSVDGSVVTASRDYVDDGDAGRLWLWENFT